MATTPERWHRIEALYNSALARDPAARAPFLDDACGEDADLRREIESLLAEATTGQGILDQPAAALPDESRTAALQGKGLSRGDRLGPYEITGLIGKGGMGEVWKARDPRVGRNVAIKRLRADYAARFKREARAIAQLNHPHICQLYDIGDDYLVMEFVDGAPLAQKLSPEDTLKFALQIASALEEAHAHGIVHRDLKPANILVTAKGAKLLDFGLASMDVASISEDLAPRFPLTEPGMVIGTVAYMSPEQAQGLPVDARSDIFSFGTVFYEALSGRRPFRRETPLATLSSIIGDEAPALEALPEFGQVIRRCMAKQPSARYQTMSELRLALEQIALKQPGDQPSIAVLPFIDMGLTGDQEYFTDGLAEEIMNRLANVPGLKVTARTSAFAFRGKEQDIRRIADALGVRTILEGSVRRAGNRIRITAQLISAADGYHLWSERYDRNLSEVFAIQDEVAQAITRSLQMKLTYASTQPARYTPKLAAWEACLKARYYMGKSTPDGMVRAQENCEQAVALDPDYALPWVYWSSVLFLSAGSGIMPAHQAMPLARAKALRAVDIDPGFQEAHSMLGVIAGRYDYDWEECARRFQLAMAHDPVPPEVRRLYAFGYLLPMGRIDEAIEELRRIIPRDPLMLRARMELEVCLTAAGRLEEAEIECRLALDLDDQFYPAHLGLARNFALRGRTAEALAAAERAYALAPWQPVAIGLLAGLLEREADMERVEELLHKLRPGDVYGAAIGLTYFHSQRGDVDEAANWYERAIEQRDPRSLNAFYLLGERFRSGPRWRAVVAAMNLPKGV